MIPDSISYTYVKLVVFVPVPYADKIREVLAEAGAGVWLNKKYDSVSFSTSGIGRFRPRKRAKPALGKVGKVEKVREERIETICRKRDLGRIIRAVRSVHPYEEPAIDVYPLLFV